MASDSKNTLHLSASTLNEQLAQSQKIIESRIAQILSGQVQNNQLEDALRYGALEGGKRLRPFLILATTQLFTDDISPALDTAVALELIHCSSLIHDDLPAMDDDDLRRGQPTCHIKFDEATAILVGDAFLSLAFEIMSGDEKLPTATRLKLIHALTVASGRYGMIGGQMDDIEGEKKSLTLDEIISLQQKKTGALFEYACQAGAIIAGATAPELAALKNYAEHFGLAFQITDDILDVTGTEAEVGKRLNKDEQAGKETFVSLIGLEAAQQAASDSINAAKQQLAIFGDRANMLKGLVEKLNNRKS
ncbi:MAG: polyprenyl synthetase family protein [Rhizobiales bacterium]|nr:polyprenyl synthetase family protein [Hyphomicrobiales bacterium]NRB14695.1 polyprenyl synthetase family protein [Hyphomicrobiales bacterium]